ncbi:MULTISPECIES: ABC transporter permease [unclassified Clostridium]|jgi:putative ABC transport system permease protein|uniref:ABC transporter permease n=1 Tax=unclassified Clostridium TaxID=2614128 RepID=UPI000E4B7D7C|nr:MULTISPECIES: ABC transporter permease [unclassified Clostridium]RHP94159.1 ABC transporter permease [Clostridium sp. AM54-37XD]RHP98238.1 ABC transporter permease [Clostridium sp. AM54-14XD]
MKNPLWKRLPKELAADLGKYLVIFLFMVFSIGFVSGFLVAGESMVATYDESFEKYHIENGNFEYKEAASKEAIQAIEAEGVKLYENYFYEQTVEKDGKESTLRIFKNRTEVDKVCLMKGEMPADADEIAIDRMYAVNNEINVGDTISVDGIDYKVSGYVALSDYSALFQSNSDMMFDSVLFGVAVVTDERFNSFDLDFMHMSYAWTYDEEPKDKKEEKEVSDDLAKVISQYGELETFVPRYANQAINFTGDDMGSDTVMVETMLYILIVIMGFIFAITINNTIVKEAGTIGTLRASGYTRGEMLRHYISLPIIVTLVAALIGNILGYTVFKDVAADMYYGSYSLTTYVTRWNADAFIKTTVIPILLMLVITAWMINSKLKMSPLRFLRRDLSRSRRKKAIKLPHFRFFTRFRLRVIIQNFSSYVVLFVGVVFAIIMLLFGMMMSPLLKHYQDDIVDNMIADYQYVLKMPVETENPDAEKYLVKSLLYKTDIRDEEIMVYGIKADSKYYKERLKDGEILISDGLSEKYKLEDGDTIKLEEEYTSDSYEIKVSGVCTYPAALAVFMNEETYREMFDVEDGYFSGYFSDEKLTDIDEKLIASIITEDDLTKVSRQLDRSMGEMFYLFEAFALILFMLMVYLLTKLIIEKNTVSISMVKILGYENKEINKLYLSGTTLMMAVSVVLGIVISQVAIVGIYYAMMREALSGWLTMYIAPYIYPAIFILSMTAYGIIAVFQVRRIKRIPMDEALKNVE